MPVVTLPSGVQLDLDTGEVVGQAEAKQLTAPEARKPDVDVQKPLSGQTALDVLGKFSQGFNTALFSLPDAVIRQVGEAAGVTPEEIPQFVRFFNRGVEAKAPENAVERFALALGRGAGSAVPFTGLLGLTARTNALRSALPADAGVAKRIAKDMLDFIRANPKAAVAADLGFGAAYEGVSQAVEEYATPGPGKDLLQAIAPMGVVVGAPFAANQILNLAGKVAQISPTMRLGRAATQEMFGGQPAEAFASQLAAERAPNIPIVGGAMRFANKLYAGKAERDVKNVLDVLTPKDGQVQPPGIREALEVTQRIEQDPRLKNLFLFDAAEQSLYAPIIAAKEDMYRNLSGQLLTQAQQRVATNEQSFLQAFENFAPRASMPLEDALRVTYADQARTVDNALKQVRDLQEGEALRIADRFAPQNLDELGNSLRNGILAQMDGQFFRLRNMARQFGARSGFDVEGVAIPTFDFDRAPLFPATEFEAFAQDFVKRFRLSPNERMFPEGTPRPVAMMQNQLRRLQEQREKAMEEFIPNLLREKLAGSQVFSFLSPEEQAPILSRLVSEAITGKPAARTSRKITAEELILQGPKGLTQSQIDDVRTEARRLAEKEVSAAMTFPDALDLLEAAQRYRNQMFNVYNKQLDLGAPRNQAKRILDRGEAVLRDVENFIFTNFNKPNGYTAKTTNQGEELREWVKLYKDTYQNGYEKLFPILISKRDPRGNFYTSNEQVVSKALSSAENVRNMNAIFGDDPGYARTLENIVFDKARQAPGVIKDGVLNPEAFASFLESRNMKNIVEAMPQRVQDTLLDELRTGQGMAQRIKDLEDRVNLVKDDELTAILKRSVRPDADPKQLVQQAINDPAVMRKLVNTVGADPDRRAALQRQVWNSVREDLLDPNNPVFLQDFLVKNGKSLNMLFERQHLDDLKLLAEIQRRVFSSQAPAGRLSPFRGLDEQLREKIGAGVGTIESTARAAMIRQISPMHAAVSLLSRFLTRQQTAIYESVLYKALTDPEYAHQLVTANIPLDSKKGFNTMSNLTLKAGGYLPGLLRVGAIEGVQATENEDLRLPLPTPEFTRGMAPAPEAPSRNIAQSLPARNLPPLPQVPQTPGLGYEALFPNDFVSPLLEQRKTAQP